MRHFTGAIGTISSLSTVTLTTALAVGLSSSNLQATPVYLKTDSRFPSGHYIRQTLLSRTKKMMLQRWFRVETKDLAVGWIPEDDLLTELKLAGEAVLLDATPLNPEITSVKRQMLPKGAHVLILEVNGSWVRTRPLLASEQDDNVQDTWIPADLLKPMETPLQKVFVEKTTPIFILPGDHARMQFEAKASSYFQVIRLGPEWIQIHTPSGDGYLRRRDAVTMAELGANGARPMSDLVPLRSAPIPYGNLNRNLPSGTKLKIIAEENLRWGRAKLTDLGEIWWPMNEEFDDDKDSKIHENLSTDAIFKRKIFDMASSPAIPSLKFVSAQGIYRTVDGKEWARINQFQDKNYPIAIAGNGAVFVGPYVSDDQGETFQQWIRWDSLVNTLRRHTRVTPQTLQIQEIRPEDPAGRRVVLKLSIGEEALVKLVTDDQGMSWRPL